MTTVALLYAAGAGQSFGQPFSSGSDGSYGPIIVPFGTTLTLDMPPDGVFRCTLINIDQHGVLMFRKNPLNTPVYLLATNGITIQYDGYIDVSGGNGGLGTPGQAGPGGFDGGKAGNGPGALAGDGLGPGGGKGSDPHGSYGTGSRIYGNSANIPLVGGSGGAGGTGYGGGGGGGAILLASDTFINLQGFIDGNHDLHAGAVHSDGGSGQGYGNGSGGAIRLVAPIISGTGLLRALGPGNQGRIRVDTTNRFGYGVTLQGVSYGGSYMHVFPPGPVPRLDILQAAGQNIPEGTNGQVRIVLPIGAATNQTVKVQARDFTGILPIHLVVTPDNAPSTTYTNQIDMTATNLALLTFNVQIPAGTASTINAWTR
jgi:hypothetical protein